jgi:predicted permease
LAEIASILAPVFVAAALGWGWVRIGRGYDRELMSRLISDIGAPCLVFARLTDVGVDPALMARVAGIAALAMAGFGVLGALLLRATRLPAHTFLAPLTFGNAGNMGLPLCLFAFGDAGLALGICYFAVSALSQFTVGIWIWSGRFSFGELFRTPMTWAALISVAVVWAELPVPVWLRNTTELIGGFAIPLMLLTLGVSLAELRIGTLGRALWLSVFRLAMGFGGGLLLAELFALDGTARGVLILQCSMPPAVFNYLFASRYERSPAEVAGIVVTCTLLSFATLPLLLAYLL